MKEKKNLPDPLSELLAHAMLNGLKACVVHVGNKPNANGTKPFSAVEGIYANENKKCVAVKLANGTVKVAKCSPFDSFDLEVGFALAFTRAALGGKKKVKELLAKANVIKAETPKLVEDAPKQQAKKRGRKPAGQATGTAKRGRKPRKAKKQEE